MTVPPRLHSNPDRLGRVISKTLRDKADQLPRDAGPLHHRQALALEQLCTGDEPAAPVSVTAFLDLDAAQGTGGEAGGEVEFGPQIGRASCRDRVLLRLIT